MYLVFGSTVFACDDELVPYRLASCALSHDGSEGWYAVLTAANCTVARCGGSASATQSIFAIVRSYPSRLFIEAANEETINGLPSSEKCFAKNASFVSLEIFLLFAYERLLNSVSHLMNSLRTVLF